MLDALMAGFSQATSLEVLPYLVGGAFFGLVLGVIPGLGGHFAMAMVIPFLHGLSPGAGIAFLLASHSTVAQGGGLTSILFSTPGCGQNAATLLDGPPMRRLGLAGKAAGAALTACFLGASFGVFVLAMMIPLLQKVVLIFGPAEIFILVFLALTFVAVLGKEDISRSLIAGLAGLFLAMIGLENITNQERFTFEFSALSDGLPLVPVILGLFAVAEMMDFWVSGGSLSGQQQVSLTTRQTQQQIFQGVREAFKKWWLVVRCSSIGTLMGLVPGLGSTTASFVAYGHARQTSKSPESFGHGNIEGVIAAESANDAVEGGALASTIAFGIPGSSSMAIVLAGLFVLGLQTGPAIVTRHTDLIFVMIFTVVLGNLVGTLAGMFLVNPLVRLTALSASLLVPVLMVVIVTGGFAVNSAVFDIGVVVLFGFLGYLMKRLGYSRSCLLIGFVLGAVLEKNLFLAIQLDGPYFFLNPLPLTLLLVALSFLFYNIIAIARHAAAARPGRASHGSGSSTGVSSGAGADPLRSLLETWVTGGLTVVFAIAMLVALGYREIPARAPVVILLILTTLCLLQFMRAWKTCRQQASLTRVFERIANDPALRKVLQIGVFTLFLLVAIVVMGHYAGIAVFMMLLLKWPGEKELYQSLAISVSVTLAIFILFELVFGIEMYRGLAYLYWAGYQLL
jgi:TctA family transporter